MNNYIIIILIFICLFMVLRNFGIHKVLNIQETFNDNNTTIAEGQCDGIVNNILASIEKKTKKTKSYNFIMINDINPSDSINLIKQIEYRSNSYDINITIEPNQNYNMTQWVGVNKSYDGGVDNSHILLNNNLKIEDYDIIDTKIINDIVWKKYIYIFNSSKYTQLSFKMGISGDFSKGERSFSDLIIKKSLRHLEDFKYQSDLTLFALFSKKYQNNNKFTDLIETSTIEFEKELETNSLGVNLNMNSGKIINTKQLINTDFTMFFSYKPDENQNGSLINIQNENSNMAGIQIFFQTNVNNKNIMFISVSNKSFQYNIGLINHIIIITIGFLKDEINVYINGINVKPNSTDITSTEKKLGSCPDGWRYLGDNECEFLIENKGTCDTETLFLKTNEEKINWATKCKTAWNNCDKLFKGQISGDNNSSCEVDTSVVFTNKPILLNNDKKLSGYLHNIIIYRTILTEVIIKDIYRYIIKNLLDIKSCDTVFDRPSIYKVQAFYPEKEIPNLDKLKCAVSSQLSACNFDDKTICNTEDCKNADWSNNLVNINTGCKTIINEYCRFNKSDKECNRLRELKNNNNVNSGDRARRPESTESTKLKNSQGCANNINSGDRARRPESTESTKLKNCQGCASNINLSEYIRKDKVPCWNCNLKDVKI